MADSITGIANSSIQPWLEFSHRLGFTDQTQFTNFNMTPCQLLKDSRDWNYGKDILVRVGDEPVIYSPPINSCQGVCWTSSHLRDPYRPANLLNCGLWASLASLWMGVSTKPYNNASSYTTFELPDHLMDVLQEFTKLGLYYQDLRYLIDVRDQVSWTLTDLLDFSQTSDSWVSPQPAVCSEQALFYFEKGSHEPSFRGVSECVTAICKVRRLDPDLGGIGVFISAILQLVIVIAGSFALLAITAIQRIRGSARPKHAAVISAALIGFHKSQCYFISAVSFASIALSNKMNTYDLPLSFESFMVVIPLALNGCVPVVSTLQIISRYARLSWHTISLAMVSLLLSTIALVKARSVWGLWSMTTDPDANDQWRYQMTRLVCGSDAKNLNNLSSSVIDFTIVWLIYSFCIVYFLACVTGHILTHTNYGLRISQSLRTFFYENLPETKRIRLVVSTLGNATIMILWLSFFAYSFFIYDRFRKSNFVSPEWSFGQIVAIAVWVPSIVDFVYMERLGIEEASNYRYPPGWEVVKTLAQVPGNTDKS